MKCPYCDKRTRVIDSRKSGENIRRRRICIKCNSRFTTTELIRTKKPIKSAQGKNSKLIIQSYYVRHGWAECKHEYIENISDAVSQLEKIRKTRNGKFRLIQRTDKVLTF